MQEKCPACKSTGLSKTHEKYHPLGPGGVRRWPVTLPHQSTIGVTEGADGGSTGIISRPRSKMTVDLEKTTTSYCEKVRSNETFVRSEAHDRLCVASKCAWRINCSKTMRNDRFCRQNM
eukprot:1846138-Pyramimonas_sp.AAC.1